ncbi:MAG TPA: T9SS type A sorting domain-containing protein, partial [Saprospiraceae bacterium]|nr:T9SS type A sorting domain-containing protein [Saprospiraceae bacterium]
ANGCSYADDIVVEVFALPEVVSQIMPAGIWFPGANIGAIDLEISNGTSPFTYFWDNFATTQDLTDLAPGRYCLFLEDGNGCREQYCYTVTGGFYKISPFHLLCRGDSKRLSIRPQTGAAFKWSPADGLSCTDCPNPIASPNQTTQYTVTATLPGGFSESTNVVVVVLPPPFCDFAQSREFDTKEESETFLRPYNLKIESKNAAAEDILLFPNPTSGQITIRSKTNIERVEVLDNLGRTIQTFIPDARDFLFDLSGAKGSRILKIVTNDQIIFRKVMLSN